MANYLRVLIVILISAGSVIMPVFTRADAVTRQGEPDPLYCTKAALAALN